MYAGSRPSQRFNDIVFSATPGTDAAPSANVHLVAPGNLGNAEYNRSSSAVKISSLRINGQFTQTSTPTTPCKVKMSIVVDKFPRGTLPLITDIWLAQNSLYFPSKTTDQRFRILKEYTISFPTYDAGGGVAASSIPVDLTIRLPVTQNYSPGSSTSGIGDIETNAVFIIVRSSTVVAETPAYYLQTRLTYF